MIKRRKTSVKRAPAQKCFFCQKSVEPDYKKPEILKKFITERQRILPRKISGVCAKHQRRLARQIKRARHLALLPFVSRIH